MVAFTKLETLARGSITASSWRRSAKLAPFKGVFSTARFPAVFPFGHLLDCSAAPRIVVVQLTPDVFGATELMYNRYLYEVYSTEIHSTVV